MKSTMLAMLVTLVLVGCGGPGAPADRLAAAQQATMDAESAAFTVEQTIEGGSMDGYTTTSEGEIDFTNANLRITVAMPDDVGDMEMLFDGSAFYLRMPQGLSPTPWVKVEDLTGFPGMDGLQDTSSPDAWLGLFDGAVSDVTEVGTEQIRGVDATGYRFTVDVVQALENAPEEHRDALQRQVDTAGVQQFPVEVWLDGQNRVVRQSFTMDLSAAEMAGVDGALTTRMEFYDFGRTVTIEVPPEAEVTDIGDLHSALPESMDLPELEDLVLPELPELPDQSDLEHQLSELEGLLDDLEVPEGS